MIIFCHNENIDAQKSSDQCELMTVQSNVLLLATMSEPMCNGGWYRFCEFLKSILFTREHKELVALKGDKRQAIDAMESAQITGGHCREDNYPVLNVNGRECGVGLEGTLNRVLSPIEKHLKRIPHSKLRMSSIAKYCHTFSSKRGLSSHRTRAAAGAYVNWSTTKLLSRNTIRNRIKYFQKKVRKQREKLFFIPESKDRRKFSVSYLKRNVVVFDGTNSPGVRQTQLKRRRKPKPNRGSDKGTTKDPPLRTVVIKNGGLEVFHPPNDKTGLAFKRNGGLEPIFILLPREEALKMNNNGKKVCGAMKRLIKQYKNVERGHSKRVFTDNKYCCVGAKPRRNAVGVEPGHYKKEYGVDSEDWDIVVDAVRRAEHAFHTMVGTEVISRIRTAKASVGWERAKSSRGEESKIFNGIAFGVNLHLRAHVDDDFTYSVIQVQIDEMEYGYDDEVACYFCFPTHGIAVPMRPGDFLLINALEYHCVSSRCNITKDVFCMSSYLKTAVVGGNDNKRKLNLEEQDGLEAYDKIIKECERPVKKKRSKKKRMSNKIDL